MYRKRRDSRPNKEVQYDGKKVPITNEIKECDDMSKWPAVCGGRVTPQLINRILMYVGEFGYMTVWYSVTGYTT